MVNYEPSKRAIEIIAKAGFITRDLWRDHIFGGAPKTAADKRRFNWAWKKLVDSEYLKRHPNKYLSNVLVLERKKASTVRHHFGAASFCPFESQFHHDEMLLQGILKAKSAGIFNQWLLETELKSEGRQEFLLKSQGKRIKHPDAVLSLSTASSASKIAVELELTLKNKGRYKQIISTYCLFEDLPLILFVTGTPAIENAIRKAVRSDLVAANSGRFGFMRLTDWLENSVDSEILWDGKRTTLRKIAQN